MLSGKCEIKLHEWTLDNNFYCTDDIQRRILSMTLLQPGSNFAPLSTRFVAQHVKNQDRYDKVHTQSLVILVKSECLFGKLLIPSLQQGSLFYFFLSLK